MVLGFQIAIEGSAIPFEHRGLPSCSNCSKINQSPYPHATLLVKKPKTLSFQFELSLSVQVILDIVHNQQHI